MTPKFASYDGMPVRLTDHEAWTFADGKWHELHAAEAGRNARLISETDYNRRFRHLPALPDKAFAQAEGKPDVT